jgi:dienelactone hydrolase
MKLSLLSSRRWLVLVCGSSVVACTSNEAATTASSAAASTSPAIHVVDETGRSTESVFYEDSVSIEITGLAEGEPIAISAEMDPWRSTATFIADAGGTVSTARDAPVAGSYSGVDRDGLFWSMDTSQLTSAGIGNVRLSVTREGSEILSANLERTAQAPGVREVNPSGASFVGKLLLPPGEGPFPALVAFGGSEGGLSGGLIYAGDLTAAGYAVLALAYFGEAGLPQALVHVPLEYFDGALAWLAKRPEVRPDRLGVIGASRGGEAALLVASRHPELKAVVADAPSAYVWADPAPPWTSDGLPLPFVAPSDRSPDRVSASHGMWAYAYAPVFLDAVLHANPSDLERARIHVEKIHAPVALFAGADDKLWPSCEFEKRVSDKVAASGGRVESTCFPNAGHRVASVLGVPTTWSDVSSHDSHIALGGTPAGTAKAGRERRAKLLSFLAKTLGSP